MNVTLIKLGGSLITDKNKAFTAKPKIISRLVQEIKQAIQKKKLKLIIAHGSGSFGHTTASKYQTQKGIAYCQPFGLAKTSQVAVDINRIVLKSLINHQLPVISLSPLSMIISNNQNYSKIFIKPITKALSLQLIPLIYGDVILDKNLGCCIFSAEKILSTIISHLPPEYKINKIIQCGITNGVTKTNQKTIPVITPQNLKSINQYLKGSASQDVTGGMKHKVLQAINILKKSNVSTHIINGLIANNLYKSLINQKVNNSTCITRSIGKN